ncbi:MAG: elongation factor P--(R)-beta-lysine ligase [Saccharospirillaceae bacterium]|nr:elongation factor P--(R)-beta-lysine ligase [Pseudomonadales bacterium]NRB78621.1 elongation factor P--(R)-beta-lysine ligase [Saccharospirillaceae bacterium]
MQNQSQLWRPSASIENLKKRAKIIGEIRSFFDGRDCFEVSTPLLSQFGNTDPNLDSFIVAQSGYLNTSPEFHMKRLLASGSGAIYQICSAFRCEEQGMKHNSEFTLLEWYRPFWSIDELMLEMIELLHRIFPKREVETLTYGQALFHATGINWLQDSTQYIEQITKKLLGEIPKDLERDELLDLLFCTIVEPSLPADKWCFITHYPPSQAALAKKILNKNGDEVAMRFELYSGGVELANGYWELTDWQEQLNRFEDDNQQRKKHDKAEIKIDTLLVDALKYSMPDCSGVALGLDRVMMLVLQQDDIKQVISFDSQRA